MAFDKRSNHSSNSPQLGDNADDGRVENPGVEKLSENFEFCEAIQIENEAMPLTQHSSTPGQTETAWAEAVPPENAQVEMATGIPSELDRQTNISAGNRRFVEGIVEQYHGQLFGFAYRLTGNQSEAEDITQQTLMIAVARIGQVRDATKIKSWLMVTLKNCFLKSNRRKRPKSESSLEINVEQLSSYSPRETWVDEELLQRALDQLSDEHRIILTMYYYQQLSYREIATSLELKVGTVMSRLSRAKSSLRGLLVGPRKECKE